MSRASVLVTPLGVTWSPWLPNQQDNSTREGAENNPKTMEQPKQIGQSFEIAH